ncbi:MAG: nucleotidyltransferase domain-containing protein [Chloroflexi bacterium]|nr:nucleotidyltransferase domain-containing protein [Chloroflexota bacterium]
MQIWYECRYGSEYLTPDTICSEDVLIIVREDFDYGDMLQRTSLAVSTLSLEHGVVISRIFISKERFLKEQSPFLLNVRREGVVLIC